MTKLELLTENLTRRMKRRMGKSGEKAQVQEPCPFCRDGLVTAIVQKGGEGKLTMKAYCSHCDAASIVVRGLIDKMVGLESLLAGQNFSNDSVPSLGI